METIPAIDLFAGAGGLSVGAHLAGADVRVLLDFDSSACATLRVNRKWHSGVILETEIADVTGRQLRKAADLGARDPLLIVGGPPCQPFSKAAFWTDPGGEAKYRRARAHGIAIPRPSRPRARPDERRTLVQEFWRLVLEARADAFILENVPSLLAPRNRRVLDNVTVAAREAGFKVTVIRANAVEFGVAQRRERVFVVGARRRAPEPPSSTHSTEPIRSGKLRAAVTAGSAIERYADSRFFEPEEVVEGRWAEHLRAVPPGWNYKAHTAWGGHPRPTFETETRFWNFLLKLSPDLPSWTVPANPGPWVGPFHWDSRRLRTPELAALQGFPNGYRFTGSRRDRVRQIGNAVPAPLARQMVEQVLEAMTGAKRR
jgi:DNA (cytosine-5)-methyltransferase 1